MFHKRRFAIGVRGICRNDEPCGPTVIVLLIIATLLTSMVLTIVHSGSNLFKVTATTLSGNDTLFDAKIFILQTPIFSTNREFTVQQYISALNSTRKLAYAW